MLGHVGHQVVDVVRGFPPADGETAAEICDEGANQCVHDEIAGYTAMACIVGCEHDLLPE